MVIAFLLLALVLPQTPAQKEEKQENKTPKRGDIVVARGCLRGSVLEGADLGAPGGGSLAAEPATYRLTGEKDTMEALRKEHDGHSDLITGELRTDLPTSTNIRGKKVGNTRITIGVGASRGMGPEPPPPMPVLRVKSFEHTGATCR
jgi:hypothetical protein